MSDDERPKGMIFCGRDGKWKEQLEKRLQTDERVTLTALGDVRSTTLCVVASVSGVAPLAFWVAQASLASLQ